MAIIKNSKEGSLVGYVSVKNERYKDFDFINNVALHGTYNLSLSYKDFMLYCMFFYYNHIKTKLYFKEILFI